MNRREMLVRSGAAALTLGLSRFPMGWLAAADAPKRRILMYTKSVSYEHDVVHRNGNELSLAEQIVTDLGRKHNFDVTCTKDGRVFDNEDLTKYDAFLFETQGDLTKVGTTKDRNPPMSAAGKKALLQAVAGGKGFVGCHCASDTFHSHGPADQNQEHDKVDPYIRMVGGEFISHGSQQKAWMRVADHEFLQTKDLKDFQLLEEWYSLKNFAANLHVILVQETKGMHDWQYQRPNYPATWARKHHKGRVFFTSMGHRDDVWKNHIFQPLLLGGLSWATGNVDADVSPNIKKVAPEASVMPHPGKKA